MSEDERGRSPATAREERQMATARVEPPVEGNGAVDPVREAGMVEPAPAAAARVAPVPPVAPAPSAPPVTEVADPADPAEVGEVTEVTEVTEVAAVEPETRGLRSPRPLAEPTPALEPVSARRREPANGFSHRVQIIAPPRPKTPPGPVRVTGFITSVGPWSVFKLSLFFSFLGMLAMLGALAAVYFVLESNGSLEAVEKLVRQTELDASFEFDAGWIFTRLFWIGCLATVAMSVVLTLLAILYNAISDLIGGLKLTIQEPESVGEPERPEPREPIRWSATTEPVSSNGAAGAHGSDAGRGVRSRLRRAAGMDRPTKAAGEGRTSGGATSSTARDR